MRLHGAVTNLHYAAWKQLGLALCLIFTVSENGFGKRTDATSTALPPSGGRGAISMKTIPRSAKSPPSTYDTTEIMLISQFGKIIRIDSMTIRSAGRSTFRVKLLTFDTDDKAAA